MPSGPWDDAGRPRTCLARRDIQGAAGYITWGRLSSLPIRAATAPRPAPFIGGRVRHCLQGWGGNSMPGGTVNGLSLAVVFFLLLYTSKLCLNLPPCRHSIHAKHISYLYHPDHSYLRSSVVPSPSVSRRAPAKIPNVASCKACMIVESEARNARFERFYIPENSKLGVERCCSASESAYQAGERRTIFHVFAQNRLTRNEMRLYFQYLETLSTCSPA